MLYCHGHFFGRASQAIGVTGGLTGKLPFLCEQALLYPVMQPDNDRTSLAADVFVLGFVQLQTTIKASNDAGGKGM